MTSDLATTGKELKKIPVDISYKIIELFSGHLYSSPSKAVEELVANSYDAFATECFVAVPESKEGVVWVWDNGDSMDEKGLTELWMVARSFKRDHEEESRQRGRLPIGRFGIGKLASYVIGHRITHLCKKNGEYLAVTMDYDSVLKEDEERMKAPGDSDGKSKSVELSMRQLTRSQVGQMIPFVFNQKHGKKTLGEVSDSRESWTVVVVEQLKEYLSPGRLSWILATALPLRPDFGLWLNGEKVESSKTRIPVLERWTIGKDDHAAEKSGYAVGESKSAEGKPSYHVEVPKYGQITGYAELYLQPLDVGKAELIGASHGFFVMVRDRVINLGDNRFGITNIPYLAFNQIRVVVHADYLDDFLTASREDIFDASAKDALKKYLHEVYNIARSRWDRFLDDEVKKESLEEHLRNMPSSLIGFPLRQAIDRLRAEDYNGFMIRREPKGELIPSIESIDLRNLSPSDPLVSLQEGQLIINASHPFYASYAGFPGFRKFAVAELLLEAYMVEAGFDTAKLTEVLTRRDQLLRNLADRFPEGTLEAAETLRNSVDSELGLEIAIVDAFRSLGFDASHIGGSGKPDGFAIANLGFDTGGKQRSYKVTMDGKSTQYEVVKSGNIGLATIKSQKLAYDADYAIVVGVNYEGGDDENSKASKEAVQEEVCLVRAKELADLLVASTVKPLSLVRFRELLELRTPMATGGWIRAFIQEKPTSPPIKEVLEILWSMQEKDPHEAPTVNGARYKNPSLQKWTVDEIVGWLQVIQRLNPELLVMSGERVLLNQSPDNIIKHCVLKLASLPKNLDASPIGTAMGIEGSIKK